MDTVTEIAPDVYRIMQYVPEFDLQFSHFLVKDEEPLLYHTGMRAMFPAIHEAVASIIDPATIRWISASHFEVDEWGALNQWLAVAPHAQAISGMVSAMVNLQDFADRPPRGLQQDEVITTGTRRYRYRSTPHLPHGWDAGVLYEESAGILFCSDLFHQGGQREALTEADILEPVRDTLTVMQQGPLMDYMPYTPYTDRLLRELGDLHPTTLAVMHGSCYRGDGAAAINGLRSVMRDVLGEDDKG
jgi:flavorubredoxin